MCSLPSIDMEATVYKWQRGITMPTIDNLLVLASVFGTTIDAIIVRTAVS